MRFTLDKGHFITGVGMGNTPKISFKGFTDDWEQRKLDETKLRGKKVEEKMMILYNVDICKCKECGETLRRFRVDGRYMLC